MSPSAPYRRYAYNVSWTLGGGAPVPFFSIFKWGCTAASLELRAQSSQSLTRISSHHMCVQLSLIILTVPLILQSYKWIITFNIFFLNSKNAELFVRFVLFASARTHKDSNENRQHLHLHSPDLLKNSWIRSHLRFKLWSFSNGWCTTGSFEYHTYWINFICRFLHLTHIRLLLLFYIIQTWPINFYATFVIYFYGIQHIWRGKWLVDL